MIRKADLDKRERDAQAELQRAEKAFKDAQANLAEASKAHNIAIAAVLGLLHVRNGIAQAAEEARQKAERAKHVKEAKAKAAVPICDFLKKLEADRVECQQNGNLAGVASLTELINEQTRRRERALA